MAFFFEGRIQDLKYLLLYGVNIRGSQIFKRTEHTTWSSRMKSNLSISIAITTLKYYTRLSANFSTVGNFCFKINHCVFIVLKILSLFLWIVYIVLVWKVSPQHFCCWGGLSTHTRKKNTNYLGIVDDEKLHSYINKLIVIYFILFQITTYEKQV